MILMLGILFATGLEGRLRRGVDLNLGGICAEEIEVVHPSVMLIRAAETDDDEADKGGDGAYHG